MDVKVTAQAYLEALGGAENIKDIDGCATRLRSTLVDPSKVNVNKLRAAGMVGRPIVMGKGVQVVVGTYADLLGEEINRILKQK
jgi:N-acetylglucosamine PTS system EIIB component